MGNQKQKWTAEEEAALKAGVAKHGAGKWKNILVDPEFAPKLANRSNVDLKDKWRNMGANHGQSCRDSSTTPKAKATPSTALVPMTGNISSFPRSKEKANDNRPCGPQNDMINPKYSVMILEALSSLKDPLGSDIGSIASFIEQKYEVPQNFKRLLSSKMRKLVLQGKLEKVIQRYKIKDSVSNVKPLTLKRNDVGKRPLQLPTVKVAANEERIDNAAEVAAQWIAVAENKEIVAAESFKEFDRVSQWAEDTNVLQMLCEEFLEQCSHGEYMLLN